MSERLQTWLIAAVLGVVTIVAVGVAQRSQGIVRDEVVYMNHGSKYAKWWVDGDATEKSITDHFGGKGATDNNREHPPLMKTLFGFSEMLFHDELGMMSSVTAYRFPNAVFYGLLVMMVFFFTRSIWGQTEAIVAALTVLFLPRAFFHAGVAAFDAPIVTVWFATLFAYYKALQSTWNRWTIIVGICFGLTLATKHNALLLQVALEAHFWFLVVRHWVREDWSAGFWRPLGRGLARGRPLITMSLSTVGLLVLVALWPWLWFDTFGHIGDWLSFHFNHVHYNFEYLGDNWNAPRFPWHVAIVTTLVTVPLATFAAGVVGAGALLRRAFTGKANDPDRAPALILFLSAGVSMGPFLLGTTPIFGAEKHWGPAIPTICIFAGIGVVVAGRLAVERLVSTGVLAAARELFVRRAVTYGIATIVISAAAISTYDAQPYALSHYNSLAGGAPGGADLGMNRQFWGYSARGVLPFLNDNTEGKTLVYTHDASPSWHKYRELGLVEKRIHDTGSEYRNGIGKSDYALVVHELHFNRHDYLIWTAYKTVQPVYVLRTDGVPIVSVYEKPKP
jgi:hypothetical protein